MNPDAMTIRGFFENFGATTVTQTPIQPIIPADEDVSHEEQLDRNCEIDEAQWQSIVIPEAPTKPGEAPQRFIDGSHISQPVLCLRSPQGWPIPLVLGEVGAVGLRLDGRRFTRDFVAIDRVLSFVADPFPWEDVEAFTAALVNNREMSLRVLPANMPMEPHNPFDYEVMRNQARARAQSEMTNMERLALAHDRSVPTLIDGGLNRLMGAPAPHSPLMIGVIKSHAGNYLHERGWQTLVNLLPGQRTPYFKYAGIRGDHGGMPVASWYLKLAGGDHLAPNWGYVRVEIPWQQFEKQFRADPNMINRLSRWLIDARCRSDDYARMPVSLEPIVRAEEALKPLFTSFAVLTNRFYRQAGLFRRNKE